MKLLKAGIGVILALTIGAVSLTGCDTANTASKSGSSSASSKPVTVKVGVVGSDNDQWNVIKTELAKQNITIQLVEFSDYTLPNQALADGEIDLNAFQHKAYLQNEIKTKGYKISSIGDTIIAPLGLYSKKVKSVSDIKSKDKIAIPNDAVNGGRALKLLEAAGLITVNASKGYNVTVSDITANPKNLQIVQVDASQTVSLLPDVAAAVINGGYAVDGGLNPTKDSIALEKVISGSNNLYINIIAARTADKDNPVYKKVVDAYHTDAVKNVIETTYKGAYIVAW